MAAMREHSVGHACDPLVCCCCDVGEAVCRGKIRVLLARVNEQAGDEHRLGRAAVLGLHRLERLARFS